jgi:threonine aldolase
MDIIDLRSDTVTQPTPHMRQAMAQAAVGDDVYGEDPSVNRLQELAAGMLGKEAALFVASGTMGNLISLMAQCRRGEEVILGNRSHIFMEEAGGYSVLGGVYGNPLPNQVDGTLELEAIQRAIHDDSDPHHARTALIALENTQNLCGGKVLSAAYTRTVGNLAHTQGLKLHLDGARIFNAAVAQGVKPAELAAPADSVQFCLSKGLCAPVGSMICGSNEFIHQARRIRKQLGGGMRQAGELAAAGIVALEEMVDRLAEDHARARKLANCLADIPGLMVNLADQETNMVYFGFAGEIPLSTVELAQKTAAQGLMIDASETHRIRLVTHYWIDDQAVERAAQILGDIITNL